MPRRRLLLELCEPRVCGREPRIAIGQRRVQPSLLSPIPHDAGHIARSRVFGAASNAECLPDEIKTIRLPQMLQELANKRR